MRVIVFLLAVLLLVGERSSFCFAQEPAGPATPDGVLDSDETRKTAEAAEVAAAVVGPKRPAGAVARPKEGMQHPDLDKAWADYDAVVAKVTESIKAAVAKQFDAAAAKGDLDAAEKWQAIGDKFDSQGAMPSETETKAVVGNTAAELKKAEEKLASAYEGVVKLLTMEKKLADAKAVRLEFTSLRAPSGDVSATPSQKEPRKANVPRQKWTLVLWNTHNGHWGDRGTKTCDISATFEGKTVFEKKGLEVPWFRDRDAHAAVEILSPGIDSIRVSITSWNGPGSGGLAEIQLFDEEGQNIAPTYLIEASAPGEAATGARVLIDGDTSAGSDSRWCLPNGTLGWVEIHRRQNATTGKAEPNQKAGRDRARMESTKIVGDQDGIPFEDEIPPLAELAVIRVRSGGAIDAIQAVYRQSDGSVKEDKQHGGGGGRPSQFELMPGEHIVGISGQVRDVIGSIQFHTNRRVSPKYGEESPDGKPFMLAVPQGKQFAGFTGRAGQILEAIGLRYRARK